MRQNHVKIYRYRNRRWWSLILKDRCKIHMKAWLGTHYYIYLFIDLLILIYWWLNIWVLPFLPRKMILSCIWFYIWSVSSVQWLSHVWLFATPWTAAHQASLSITNSRSLPKLMSIESVMPSNHLILCHSLLLLPSIFPSTRVFSNESVLHIRWLKYWSFSFNISPSNEYLWLISFRMDWLDLHVVQGTLKSLLNTTVQNYQFFSTQLSL